MKDGLLLGVSLKDFKFLSSLEPGGSLDPSQAEVLKRVVNRGFVRQPAPPLVQRRYRSEEGERARLCSGKMLSVGVLGSGVVGVQVKTIVMPTDQFQQTALCFYMTIVAFCNERPRYGNDGEGCSLYHGTIICSSLLWRWPRSIPISSSGAFALHEATRRGA